MAYKERSFIEWVLICFIKDLSNLTQKMAKFTFQIDEYTDGIRLVDSYEITIDAADRATAIQDIKKAYPMKKGYECTLKNCVW